MPPKIDAPSPDDQPATRKDLALLAAQLRTEMQQIRAELLEKIHALSERMNDKVNDQTRTILIGQFASSITLAALLIAAAKL